MRNLIVGSVTVLSLICVVAIHASPLTEQNFKTSIALYESMSDADAYRVFLQNFRPEKKWPVGDEFETRKNIFRKNLETIRQLNEKSRIDGNDATAGVNSLADLTHDEYLKRMGKLTIQPVVNSDYRDDFTLVPGSLPAHLDWRDKGAVTPVKNQEDCGSCWAFSATGALETCHFLNNGTLVPLSEQQILNCNGLYSGCEGGYPAAAFEYVIKSRGLCSESSFPYMEKDQACLYKDLSHCQEVAHISSYKQLPKGNDDSLLDAIQGRTISVAMDASRKSFHLYSSGVYSESVCSKTKLDHAVLVVGYGTTASGKDYWLIKNSWGEDWGEAGYFMLDRGAKNMCGISTAASYPVH